MSVDSGGPGRGIETTPQYRQDHQPKVSIYDMNPAVAGAKKTAWDEIAKQILANSQQAYAEGGGATGDAGAYSAYGGGGGGGYGGGGGGGGGGLNPTYVQAMKDYLAQKEAGRTGYLSPFEQAQSGVDAAYRQSQAQIAEGGAQQDQRLAAAQQLQDQYNTQLKSAYTNPGAQFDFSALLSDLGSQGAGQGGLKLQAQLAQANQGMDASRRSTLADSLVAGRNFDNAQRADIARQLTQGMNGQLDINHMQALAAIAKQRAAAEQAYNDQIAQLRLEMAKAGIA